LWVVQTIGGGANRRSRSFVSGKIIDASQVAARKLGVSGLMQVCLNILSTPENRSLRWMRCRRAARAYDRLLRGEDARRHGFIEAITIPTMPQQDVFYLTDQYLAGLPG
jgi:hypothetical protein